MLHTGLPYTTETGIKIQGKELSLIPEIINSDGEMLLNTNGEINVPGHYKLQRNDSSLISLAFNLDRKESDLRVISDDEFQILSDKNAVTVFDGSPEKLDAEFSKSQKGTGLWKWCITFALFFLLVEILLIRFFKTHVRPLN